MHYLHIQKNVIQKLLTGIPPIGQITLCCICINFSGIITGFTLSHRFLEMQFNLCALRSEFFHVLQISHVRVEKHDAKLISLDKYLSQICCKVSSG